MFKLGTVEAVAAEGVAVIVDGETSASPKKYTRLASCECAAGDRVLLAQISGTYIVVGVLTR